MLLRSIFSSVTGSNCAGLADLFSDDFGVVLICHTVIPVQLIHCLSLCHTTWSQACIMLLNTDAHTDLHRQPAAVSTTPATLIRAVQQVITTMQSQPVFATL